MLAAMAIPLGPLEFHVTLAGPVGVLLGGAGAFQVVFVVSVILALMGHGGLTVVGLNALVLGAGAAIAVPVYRLLVPRLSPAWSLAIATGASQVACGAMWLIVVGLGMWLGTGAAGNAAIRIPDARLGVFAAVSLPLWLLGLAAETLIAFGLGRFLARVQPGLLPQRAPAPDVAQTRPAGRPA
jgi:cobalt/nickel transport system permease protein